MDEYMRIKKARTTFKKERSATLYDDIFNQLQSVIAFGKNGNNEEYELAIDSLKKKLESMIDDEQLDDELSSEERDFDRTILPRKGGAFAENDKARLVVISEKEKQNYMEIFEEYSYSNSEIDRKANQALWESTLHGNSFVCSIYDKKTNQYVGYCSIKNLKKVIWEIAIEEKKEWRNKGYGACALDLFMTKVTKLTGNRYYRARVDVDNYPSQALMKKLGAKPNGISEFMLHGDELKEFQKENLYLINDNIRNVATEFCMKPEEIIGYVLEYKFDRESDK